MGYTLKKYKKSYIHLSISNIFSTFAAENRKKWGLTDFKISL